MNILKMGIIGGGPGSMIGNIHRITATASGKAKLVCGAFSTDPVKCNEKGKELGLDANRIYSDYEKMIETESQLPASERMDFVVIATPNHLHVKQAQLALKYGFHVMCDKPLGISLKESLELRDIAQKKEVVFAMSYTYRGYPLLKKAAGLVANGQLGQIRKVKVDYSQGWLSELIEAQGNKQAAWRTNPDKSGKGGTIADIGTHAFNLLESVSSLKVNKLFADVSILVEGRQIDDDTNILLEMENGAKGTLSVSQMCTGEDNDLSLHLYGEKAGLVWRHSQPNELHIRYPDFTEDVIKTVEKKEKSNSDVNIPGHSPYFTEGFQTIYEAFFRAIENKGLSTEEHYSDAFSLPNIEDGIRGMLFIEKALESSQKRQWVKL